ncbi:MAG: pilus assembly protein [Anaerolineae bacterium]|nr:pilus assembly protein [Anaerolineae bacterium]
MDTPQNELQRIKRRRKGQTLAEFAITLPILLILVFGVIEFGRVFQAWVTLQNAARTAARYASTGQFNETKYPVNENQITDETSIIDCRLDEDSRGSLTNLSVDGATVQVYDGSEGFFATWYDGENCEPNRIDHQDMRKDIARTVSIIDEARRGAAGLALGPDPLEGVNTEAGVRQFLYKQWERPLPVGENLYHEGWDQPSYFDVMICSSRSMRNEFSSAYNGNFPTRFMTVLDAGDIAKAGGPDPFGNDNRAPVCVLNEQPPVDGGSTQNAGVPWLDAGGPGDAVTVVITFNHPLITPLGLAPYIPLQARRAAVNEAFRAAEATGALQGGAAITADLDLRPTAILKIKNPGVTQVGNIWVINAPNGTTQAPVLLSGEDSSDPDGTIVNLKFTQNQLDATVWVLSDQNEANPVPTDPIPVKPEGRFVFPTNQVIEVFLEVKDDGGNTATTSIQFMIKTPDPTVTPSLTPSAQPSLTPIPPFSCDLLKAGNLSFFNNRVYIEIQNQNFKSTVLTRANFNWKQVAAFPNMTVNGLSLNGILHWRGQDNFPPTDTNADTPTPSNVFIDADRTVPGEDTSVWEAVFNNGPAPIQDPFNNVFWMTQYDFAGTTFSFANPEGGADCVIPLNLATPTPSPTVNPNQATNTPTWTPDCAGSEVKIRFENFDTFGVVRLVVTNLRVVPANFSDFSVNWVKRSSQQVLEKVIAGGESAADLTNGTLIWQAASGQDAQPPTVGGTTGAAGSAVNNYTTGATGPEGQWMTNYSFPPNSTTNLWIKFGVTNSTPDTAFGMVPSDLNGSWFQIGCGTPPTGGEPGGGSGTWYGGDGRITIFQEPSPFPTYTLAPSNTPRPTFTPGPTSTTGPTNTAAPPPTITNTPRPSNTPPPAPTDTEVPPDGPPSDGSVDG